jgi:hypothetical protein
LSSTFIFSRRIAKTHSLLDFFHIDLLLYSAAALALLSAPLLRSFRLFDFDYNEGWNVYQTVRLANHQMLYPPHFDWTLNNYPALWFWLLSGLHHVTQEYLFTARFLSLIGFFGSCALVGAIVRQLTGNRRAAFLAFLFTAFLFVLTAESYIGMDDPQLFSQLFFLGGILLYLRSQKSWMAIAGTALLLVIGGSFKHMAIVDVPLAILIDLWLISRRRALGFAAIGLSLVALSVELHLHLGGPYFLHNLLAPRDYTFSRSFFCPLETFAPELLPLAMAVFVAWMNRHDDKRRLPGIWLATSLPIGAYFSGGHGVVLNAFFSSFLAMSILVGLFLDRAEMNAWKWMHSYGSWATPLLFLWMLIPYTLCDQSNPLAELGQDQAAEERFSLQVKHLNAISGPALCESMLRCYYADKPFLYDGFNTTRLMSFGLLDANELSSRVQHHQFAAIQLNKPLSDEIRRERFPPAVLTAIPQYYRPAFEDQDIVLYVPL